MHDCGALPPALEPTGVPAATFVGREWHVATLCRDALIRSVLEAQRTCRERRERTDVTRLTRMYGPAVRCKRTSSSWRICGLEDPRRSAVSGQRSWRNELQTNSKEMFDFNQKGNQMRESPELYLKRMKVVVDTARLPIPYRCLVSLGFRVGNSSAIGWHQPTNFPASLLPVACRRLSATRSPCGRSDWPI